MLFRSWEVRKQSLEDLARTTAAANFVVLNRDLGLDQALSGYLEGIKIRSSLGIALVLDSRGTVIAEAEPVFQRPLLEPVLAPLLAREPEIPEPSVAAISIPGSPVPHVAVVAISPIINYSRNLSGYIAVGIVLNGDHQDGAEPFFGDAKAQIGIPFFILGNGEVYYASESSLADSLPPAVLDAENGTGLPLGTRESLGQSRYLLGYAPLEEEAGSTRLGLLVAYPAGYREIEQRQALVLVLAVIAGSLAAALPAGLLLAANLSTPMAAVARGARAIASGDYTQRLPVLSSDEIGQMAEEFNRMTQKLSLTMEALAREAEEHLSAENQVRELNKELEAGIADRNRELAEKSVLLKEVHHRVKNNMQLISSLLYLQRSSLADPALEEALQTAEARIHSMAMVHESLYQSDSFGSIDLADLFRRMLGEGELGVLGPWKVEGDTVRLPLNRAVPCSLAVNELLMNAVKHAGAGKGDGIIRLGREEGIIRVAVEDRGPGAAALPAGGVAGGIGLSLVRDLAQQLRGNLEIRERPGGGASIALVFPE